jgi:hypothetical protein
LDGFLSSNYNINIKILILAEKEDIIKARQKENAYPAFYKGGLTRG